MFFVCHSMKANSCCWATIIALGKCLYRFYSEISPWAYLANKIFSSEISPWAYLANKIFSSEISPWAYARIKVFFVLWNEIKGSNLVRIKICKYFKVLNLMPNLLVIILRLLLFYFPWYMQKSHHFLHFSQIYLKLKKQWS